MNKLFFFIFLLISLWACNLDSENCITQVQPFRFKVVDNQGADLLNPDHANSYKLSDIVIYYLRNNVPDTVTYDFGLWYLSNGSQNYFHIESIHMTSLSFENACEFFIKFNNQDTDTVIIKVERNIIDNCPSYNYVMVKFNNQDMVLDSDYLYKIVK